MGLTTDTSSSRTCGWELYVYGSYRGGGQKIISDIRGFLMIVKVRVLVIQKYRNDKNNKGDFYFAGIVMRVV